MTKANRPQHDPAALASAAQVLQAAAGRLLAAGVPLEDVTALATAATAYAAEHAQADLTRPGTMTAASPVFRGAMAAVGKVRLAPLPLVPDESDHEHVWVTALDGDDEPARNADGNTWTHCGVCGDPRDGAPRQETAEQPAADPAQTVYLSTPCARPDCEHTLNWHTGTGKHGCIARGGACSCPAFIPPADADTTQED
jgi:hypothetical protein